MLADIVGSGGVTEPGFAMRREVIRDGIERFVEARAN